MTSRKNSPTKNKIVPPQADLNSLISTIHGKPSSESPSTSTQAQGDPRLLSIFGNVKSSSESKLMDELAKQVQDRGSMSLSQEQMATVIQDYLDKSDPKEAKNAGPLVDALGLSGPFDQFDLNSMNNIEGEGPPTPTKWNFVGRYHSFDEMDKVRRQNDVMNLRGGTFRGHRRIWHACAHQNYCPFKMCSIDYNGDHLLYASGEHNHNLADTQNQNQNQPPIKQEQGPAENNEAIVALAQTLLQTLQSVNANVVVPAASGSMPAVEVPNVFPEFLQSLFNASNQSPLGTPPAATASPVLPSAKVPLQSSEFSNRRIKTEPVDSLEPASGAHVIPLKRSRHHAPSQQTSTSSHSPSLPMNALKPDPSQPTGALNHRTPALSRALSHPTNFMQPGPSQLTVSSNPGPSQPTNASKPGPSTPTAPSTHDPTPPTAPSPPDSSDNDNGYTLTLPENLLKVFQEAAGSRGNENGTFSMSSELCINGMVEIAQELKLVFCYKADCNEFIFNKAERPEVTVVFQDEKHHVDVIVRDGDDVKCREVWQKGDLQVFIWAVRGKCSFSFPYNRKASE